MARPVQFDRREALEHAKMVFWKQGYAATSITDLIDATGLQPGSLYSAFKSKKALFLEVLDSYGAEMLDSIKQILMVPGSSLGAIRVLFRQLAEKVKSDQDIKGCLIVNTMLELGRHDAEVQRILTQQLGMLEALFEAVLINAQAQNELSVGKDALGVAKFLVNCIWGMHSLCSVRLDEASLNAVVDNALSVLE